MKNNVEEENKLGYNLYKLGDHLKDAFTSIFVDQCDYKTHNEYEDTRNQDSVTVE